MTSRRFSYAIDKRYLPVLLLMLLRPSRDGVALTDEDFVATFGLVKITTPRANITGAHITRNYRWWTACGIRMSYVDDGLTFGTNRDGGVCIHFAEKVRSPTAAKRAFGTDRDRGRFGGTEAALAVSATSRRTACSVG